MYSRMLMVSRRLEVAEQTGQSPEHVNWARRELYRAQCNCSYWHGAFGGIYLPHLRNAVYNHLIAADNLLDQASDRTPPWVEASVSDFNLDARQEVYLSNDRLAVLVSPARGGQIYEFDVRSICHNLLATLMRRPEAYHQKVANGAQHADGHVASIHDRVVFKQAGLDQRLQYDRYPRKSLLDHFYDNDATLADVASGRSMERGDFVEGVFEARLRRSPRRVQAVLSREGNAWGHPLRITKTISVDAGSPTVEVEYLLEGLRHDLPLHFAVELNFSGLPAGADNRFFHNGRQDRLGHLGTQLDLADVQELGMVDEWLGIDVGLQLSRASRIWTFPIETVSQSEGGFELVHQSIVVQPHWLVIPDLAGTWSVTLQLTADTAMAQQRLEKSTLELVS
jgi:alpha-amylase